MKLIFKRREALGISMASFEKDTAESPAGVNARIKWVQAFDCSSSIVIHKFHLFTNP